MQSTKALSRIASIAFILAFLSDLAVDAVGKSWSFDFVNMLWWGILVSMAIFLLLNKRNLAFLIISGINVARILYNTRYFWSVFSNYSAVNKLFIVCNILSAIVFFIIFLVGMKVTPNSKKAINVLWFIPALILAVRYLPIWLSRDYSSIKTVDAIISISCQAFHILAFLFSSQWLKSMMQDEKENAPVSLSNDTIREPIPTLGGADKLLQYKELLDSGIITQEEFNEKKKQVLGL